MRHSSFCHRLAVTLAACLVAGSSARAGEICLEASPSIGCFPCDLPTVVSTIGYSISGPPCEAPEAGEPSARGWWTALMTLSASDQDPFVNAGPFLTEETLHLWLVDSGCGYGFGGTSVGVTSDFPLESYEPVSSGTQTWSPSGDRHSGNLNLNLGCLGGCASYPPCPPLLLGTFHVSRVRSESVPLEPTTWMGLKSRWRSPPPGEPRSPGPGRTSPTGSAP